MLRASVPEREPTVARTDRLRHAASQERLADDVTVVEARSVTPSASEKIVTISSYE
jgi:hypothetical protein